MGEAVKPGPWHISVLVPARNEEHLVARCLHSILAARRTLPASVICHIVVAVDSSTDRTQQIAETLLPHCDTVVSVQAGAVGKARAIAAETALLAYSGHLDRLWLAHTDADSEVPTHWLCEQLRLADKGVAAIAGTVDVDSFAEHRHMVPQRFRETYLMNSDGSHPHVHGANLGVRADLYRFVGGWRDLQTAEDHDLWQRILQTGFCNRSCSHFPVLTSGRKRGRAPAGFAAALAAHNEPAA